MTINPKNNDNYRKASMLVIYI